MKNNKVLLTIVSLIAVVAIAFGAITTVNKGNLEKDLKAQIETLTGDKTTAETSVADLTAQVESLTAAKTTAETSVADLTAQVESLTAAKTTAETSAADLTAQVESLTAAKTTADASVAELTAQVENLTAAKTAAETSVADLTAKVESLTAAKPAVEPAAAEPTAKAADDTVVAELNAKIEKLEKDLAFTQLRLTAIDNAYIMYADGSWTNQNWGLDSTDTVKVTYAPIQGKGDYTVGLEFAEEAKDLAFAALGIQNGETTMPGWFIKINAVRVNGEAIEVKKGYTSSDNGIETRMNLYNEWVSEVPVDARSFDGHTDDASSMIVDKAAFASVKTIEIDFTVTDETEDMGYIMYADSTWTNQNWGVASSETVTVLPAEIRGAGDYTTGLKFATPAEGLAFAAVGIPYGEKTFPGYQIKINAVRVNGEAIEVKKGYTSSDNGIETRMNLFNEWVSEVPADARSYDNKVDDVSAIIVDTAAFASVSEIEVDFSLVPVHDYAYIMYADSSWTYQNWGVDSTDTVKVTSAEVQGEGTYTVGLEFAEEAQGLAFAAVGIVTGEKTFPGYYVNVTEVKVNGEAIELGKGYTSSDNGIETRENLYNEWVSEVPAEARRADGNLEGATSMMVATDKFAAVKTVEVTFEYIKGVPAVAEEAAGMSAEEAAELLKAEYNAYFGCQTKSYIFRNMWNDSYGLNDEAHPYFNQLTGWDLPAGVEEGLAEDGSFNYGGTFTDAKVNGAGTYTVSVVTGEYGFGSDESFNLLFISTDIPSALVKDGYVKIENITCKIGNGKTNTLDAEKSVDLSGDYVTIKALDSYNFADEPFGYTVPGANETITLSFDLVIPEVA